MPQSDCFCRWPEIHLFMDMHLDHVTVAGRSLDSLDRAFEGIGLAPTYGGSHSNGITHMSTVAFPDGTYVELISTLESGEHSPIWDAHIRDNAGPCAWAVLVDDAAAAAARLEERGVDVEGPINYARDRPDGVRLEWELVYLGEGDPGSVLPFLIADRTPRKRRVGSALTETGLNGVETVVVGVPNLDPAIECLRTAFDLPASVRTESDYLNADVARFAGTPVALAAPRTGGGLADRLNDLGASPCAFLFRPENDAHGHYPVDSTEHWNDGKAIWLDPDDLGGIRYLGLLDRS